MRNKPKTLVKRSGNLQIRTLFETLKHIIHIKENLSYRCCSCFSLDVLKCDSHVSSAFELSSY